MALADWAAAMAAAAAACAATAAAAAAIAAAAGPAGAVPASLPALPFLPAHVMGGEGAKAVGAANITLPRNRYDRQVMVGVDGPRR